MPKKASGTPNMNAFVKDIIDRNGIATVKNIEQVLKRIDKLEKKITAIKLASPARKAKPAGKEDAGKKGTTTGPVMEVIKKSKKGADLQTVQKQTGLNTVSIRNAFFLLRKAGKIKRVSRGVYEVVKGRASEPAKTNKPAKSAKSAKPAKSVKKSKPVKPAGKSKPKSQTKKQVRKTSKPVSKEVSTPTINKEETKHDQSGTD